MAQGDGANGTHIVPPPPPAGDISGALTVRVTGNQAPKSIFMPLVYRTIKDAVRLRPGANFSVAYERVMPPATISRGKSAEIKIPITFRGQGFTAVKKEIAVRVDNVVLQGFDRSGRLYVSNNPESLSRPGTLLSGAVGRFNCARFLYHHKNVATQPMYISLYVKNISSEPVRIHLVEGAPQVSDREFSAGHRAAVYFTRSLKGGVGRIVDYPPGADGPLYRIRFERGQVATAIFELRVLQGPGVVFAIKAQHVNDPEDGDGLDIAEFAGTRGHGEFPAPYLTITGEFKVGGPWTFIGVGDGAFHGSSHPNSRLAGNYGVTHLIKVDVSNPHERSERVHVDLAPASGPAAALVSVDGEAREIHYARTHSTVRLKSFVMPPKSARTVVIETMPESGSFYPVRIVFGARRIL